MLLDRGRGKTRHDRDRGGRNNDLCGDEELVDLVRDVRRLTRGGRDLIQHTPQRKALMNCHPALTAQIDWSQTLPPRERVMTRKGDIKRLAEKVRHCDTVLRPLGLVRKSVGDDQIMISRQARKLLLSHVLV